MNRRHFLTLLGATAGAIVLPESRRVYSFPSVAFLDRQRRVWPGVTFTVRQQEYDLAGIQQEMAARIYEAVSIAPRLTHDEAIDSIALAIATTIERHQASVYELATVIRGRVSV